MTKKLLLPQRGKTIQEEKQYETTRGTQVDTEGHTQRVAFSWGVMFREVRDSFPVFLRAMTLKSSNI